MDIKTEFIFLHIRDTPQLQRQKLSQRNGWEKTFQSDGLKKQADMAILISYKIVFKIN